MLLKQKAKIQKVRGVDVFEATDKLDIETHRHVLVQSMLPIVAAVNQMIPLFCQLRHLPSNASREFPILVVRRQEAWIGIKCCKDVRKLLNVD